MTDNDTTDTMADVSHTNPDTGETAGRLFNRGPTVAADGGERTADSRSSSEQRSDGGTPTSETADETDESTDAAGTMRDVDHTPPKEADDANRVFERGTEHGRRSDTEVEE
ncbi:hypothetical protein [Natrinema halophilum]|uniref:Uncharacterized protein n=1 Tax=Natrinema halophilum TaxID=1699371 RepID=A0A7D5GHB7_9EURY|nr:hypothetical protein [Natrinema halophilum]QLG48947.1 hypothetical protein HYG82_08825 [Natrinema halophilum]